MFEAWELNKQNEIKFVLIDSNGNEVTGLGSGFTLLISKPGNEAFVAAGGIKSEIGSGWYRYVSTVAEADSLGTIALVASGVGTIQQNMVFEVVTETTPETIWEYPTRSLTLTKDEVPTGGLTIWEAP